MTQIKLRLALAIRAITAISSWIIVVCSVLALPGYAQISSTTTVTPSTNPSAINQTVTFTARVGGAQYSAPFTSLVGRSAGATQYIRYELVETTFAAQVQATDLTNVTTPAAFSGNAVAIGGGVGTSYVVLQVTAGGTGISVSDIIQLNFAPASVTSTTAIKYSVHDTLSSAAGTVPLNSTLVAGPTTSLINTLTPPVAVTGTVAFSINSSTITGCAAVAIAAGSATCSATFNSAGLFTVTAGYSGDVNYSASSGAVAGGQSVGLGISPTSVSGLTVGTAYTLNFTATGTAPYTFAVASGALPPGLSLTSGGVLSGTPTTVGTSTFLIRVTDSTSSTGGVSITTTVAKGAQAISFNPPANAVLGSTYLLNATASSGLAVTYTVSTPNTCHASGSSLSFSAIGSCQVTALQSGDANYFAAPSTPRTINIVLSGGVKPLRLRNSAGQSLTGDLSGTNTLTFSATPDPGVNFRTIAIADLDGNKTLDLIYQNIAAGDPGDVRVWKDFDSTQDRSLRSVKLAWRVDAVGDLDGDGFGDLVWRYTGQTANIDDTGVSYVWFTNGTGVTQVRKRGGAPLNWQLLGALDVNGDGAADMLYISPTGEIRALMATSGRTCANLSAGFLPTGFTALKAGSFIRTGRPEVLIRNATTGEVRLMVFDGTGLNLPPFTGDPNDPNASCTSSSLTVFSSAIVFANTDPTWTFFGTADFNGDGFLDIVWKRSDGTAYIWLTSGSDQNLSGIATTSVLPAGYTPIQP